MLSRREAPSVEACSASGAVFPSGRNSPPVMLPCFSSGHEGAGRATALVGLAVSFSGLSAGSS
jgi:hypothetical protein